MMRRRLIACASLVGLALLLLVGVVVGLIVRSRSESPSGDTCIQPVEELPLPPLPEYRSLPPLEVVRVDWQTAERSGAWHHWRGGPLHVGALALDPADDVLWLGVGAGLLRWDLNRLSGTQVDASCYTCGRIAAIVPTSSGQLWAVGTRGDVYRFDQGGLEFQMAGSLAHGPDIDAGVDADGALWLTNVPGDWERCAGDLSDRRCERGRVWQEPALTKAMGCTSILASLDVDSFRSCAMAPGRTEYIPLEPPSCDDWQMVSGSMRCVTWDQDCAGQLVLLSIEPREVVRTVPWPSGVNLADVRWVTHNEDQVWLFSDALWLFEAGRWQCFEWPYDVPSGLVAIPEGDGVWATVYDLGLLHVNAEGVRMVHPRDSLYALPVDRDWAPLWRERPDLQLAAVSLAETADGRIWAGTDGGGLWVYDEAEALWQPTELTQAFVDALRADGGGGLWIGTRYGGIAHYDGDDGWQWWRTYSGLPSDKITALAVDEQGRAWAGTADAGLIRFDGHTWEKLEINGVEPQSRITALAADGRGSVYFGHSRGIGVCDGGRCDSHLPEAPFDGPAAALAVDQSGDLWMSNGYLVYTYSTDGEWSRQDSSVIFVGEILLGARGTVWMGRYGLMAHDPVTNIWSVAPFPDNTYDRVYDLVEDRHGRIWVARGSGVSVYDPALGSVWE